MGRWDSDCCVWTFPERYRENVVEILADIFGYSESTSGTVLVRLTVGGHALEAERDSVRVAGREVARATGRDSGARLGPGVALTRLPQLTHDYDDFSSFDSRNSLILLSPIFVIPL